MEGKKTGFQIWKVKKQGFRYGKLTKKQGFVCGRLTKYRASDVEG